MVQLMDQERFEQAKQSVLQNKGKQEGIGTLKERSLHAILKYYAEPDASLHEIKMGRFVADICHDEGIKEIQTRDFSQLRKKLDYFLEQHKVTIIYPIAYTKWLSWIDIETGEVSLKRKSPKKGVPYDIFFELYKIKTVLLHPNLSICILLMNMEEYKLLNGWSKDKKRGACRKDRMPLELVEEIHIASLKDYTKLIPDTLSEAFTAKDFKTHTGLSLRRAQTALNVLKHIGAIEHIGNEGRAYLYKRGI